MNKMMIATAVLFGASIQTPVLGDSVQAQVIDFNSHEHIDSLTNSHGTHYYSDGYFHHAEGGFGSYGTLSSAYSGSTAMYNIARDDVITFNHNLGRKFDLISIDLAEYNSALPVNVTFITDGGHSQTFTTDGIAYGAETFVFDSGFKNISGVTWNHEGSFHQFDNIVVVYGVKAGELYRMQARNRSDPPETINEYEFAGTTYEPPYVMFRVPSRDVYTLYESTNLISWTEIVTPSKAYNDNTFQYYLDQPSSNKFYKVRKVN